MFVGIGRRVEQTSVYNGKADDLLGEHVRERLYTKEKQVVCCGLTFLHYRFNKTAPKTVKISNFGHRGHLLAHFN